MKRGNYILAGKGSFFYTYKAITYNIPANSSIIDSRSGETEPEKVYLYIYAIVVSSKTILKLALEYKTKKTPCTARSFLIGPRRTWTFDPRIMSPML